LSSQTRTLPERLGVSFGVPGSGTCELTRELPASRGLDPGQMQMRHESGRCGRGADARRARSPRKVRRLMDDHSPQLLDWARADAHVALRPYLSKLIRPRGVAHLAHDWPPTDVTLLAAKASLVVRGNPHPALLNLLPAAASAIHAAPTCSARSVSSRGRAYRPAAQRDRPPVIPERPAVSAAPPAVPGWRH
jgi:hypothetical protein